MTSLPEVYEGLEALIHENELGLFLVLDKYSIPRSQLSPETLLAGHYRYPGTFAQDIADSLDRFSYVGNPDPKELLETGVKLINGEALEPVPEIESDETDQRNDQPITVPQPNTKILGIPQATFYVLAAALLGLVIFLIIKQSNK